MSTQPTLLETLRIGTHTQHTRLDTGSYATRLHNGDLPHIWVTNALAGEHAITQTIEMHLDRTSSPFIRTLWSTLPPRTPAIEHDLALLKTRYKEPITVVIRQTVAALSQNLQEHPSGLLGALYVLEGSALGGQIIVRALRQMFPEDTTCMTRFASARDVSTRWRRVCAALRAYPETQHVHALAGARDTFESFETLFAYVSELPDKT